MMRIIKPDPLLLATQRVSKETINRLIEHPCGYSALTDFGRDSVITCDRAIVTDNRHSHKHFITICELAAFKRPVICVPQEIMTLITVRMPHPSVGYAYVDPAPARVPLMTSTGMWGTPVVKRIGNPIFADAIVELLWWAWLREESQYGDIIHRPWGPVSRVPIPESIWGVYDVLPPPAGSNAALLLDHHNKFRTS
jgi:hypothetical protein